MRPYHVLAILLATATPALAGPKLELTPASDLEAVPTRNEGSQGRYVLEAKTKRPRTVVQRAPTDWIEVATPTPARHGTEFIGVGAQAGPLATLRITPSSGRVIIMKVKVVFEDGKPLVLKQRAILDARRKAFVVALDEPRVIHHIEVTTDTRTDGAYAVFGSATQQTVSAARRPALAKPARSR
jgi:hypothetical protein